MHKRDSFGWMLIMLLAVFTLPACAANPGINPTATATAAATVPPLVDAAARAATRTAEPSLVPPTPTNMSTVAVAVATPSTQYEDPDYFYEGMVVTLDSVGQEVRLKKRQNFLLRLGKNYSWKVTITPQDVISLNLKYTPEPGEQGVYVARESGKAVLRALGDPLCRYDKEPCTWPALLFQIQVLVE